MFALALLSISAAAAVSVPVSVCGVFTAVLGGSMVGQCNQACGATAAAGNCSEAKFASYPTTPAASAQLRWGAAPPGSETKQAGFGYAEVPVNTTTLDVTSSAMPVFSCGSLSHYNYPSLTNTSGTGYTLTLEVTLDGVKTSIVVPFNFTEVSNMTPCPYGGSVDCSDLTVLASDGVSLTGEGAIALNVNNATQNYLVQVFAFGSVNVPKRQFITPEATTTTTELLCRLAPPCPATCTSGQPRAVLLPDGSKVCGCTDAATTAFTINIANTTAPTTAPAGPCAVKNGTNTCNSLNCCFCSCEYIDNGQRSSDKFCLAKASGGASVTTEQCTTVSNKAGTLDKCTVMCATEAPTPGPTIAPSPAPAPGPSPSGNSGDNPTPAGTSAPGGTAKTTATAAASSTRALSVAAALLLVGAAAL